VDVCIAGQAPALGIGGDVSELVVEILSIADAVFVEAGLPDRELQVEPVRETALDTLRAAFDGLI